MQRAVRLLLVPALMLLPGCVGVNVSGQVLARNYAGQPQRIFVINAVDSSFSEAAVESFATAIQADLTRCNVATAVFRPDPMRLNAEAALGQALLAFKPDTILNMRQSVRRLQDGEVRGGNYVMALQDVATRRRIWQASISIGASTRLFADRTPAGTSLSSKVVKQMSDDGMLKSCPPSKDVKT